MKIKVTVGGLIKYKGLFLLVKTKKWKSKWGIPGGKVKQGESLIDALIREIKEETNLHVEPKQCKYITFFESIYDKEFYKPVHMILFNYLIKVNNISSIKFNKEILDHRFVKVGDFKKYRINKYTKMLIEKITKI